MDGMMTGCVVLTGQSSRRNSFLRVVLYYDNMAKGPMGNRRLTEIGPFTYDEVSPPEVPDDFEIPEHIDNARGDYRWWSNYTNTDKKGVTIIYDPSADRVIIENRLSGPDNNQYTHDDMVTDIINLSPLPRVPDTMVVAAGGVVKLADVPQSSFSMPAAAGGAWIVTKRLPSEKEIIENGEKLSIEYFYKCVYVLKMLDFPEDTMVDLEHKLGFRDHTIFTASRKFELKDAYLELQFENMLPESKI